MKLIFPDSADDWGDAFNNALNRGEFGDDPASHNFWARFELQASETEGDVIVADWFLQRNLLKYKRIPRSEKETEL